MTAIHGTGQELSEKQQEPYSTSQVHTDEKQPLNNVMEP